MCTLAIGYREPGNWKVLVRRRSEKSEIDCAEERVVAQQLVVGRRCMYYAHNSSMRAVGGLAYM